MPVLPAGGARLALELARAQLRVTNDNPRDFVLSAARPHALMNEDGPTSPGSVGLTQPWSVSRRKAVPISVQCSFVAFPRPPKPFSSELAGFARDAGPRGIQMVGLRSVRRARWGSLAALVVVFALAGRARAQSIDVAIDPPVVTVNPGDTVNVTLDVTKAGLAFNGYDAVIGYDPTALTFLPTSPLSLQEGAYMKNACGNTFHHFVAAGDSLSISHVILCADLALAGPGQLYKLRFRASSTAQLTHLVFRSVQFYNAGHFVNPDSTHDATVAIGVTLGTPPQAPPGRARLDVRPNPARGGTSIRVTTPTAGPQRLEVLDPMGRIVRDLDRGTFAPGTRVVTWDGADQRGLRVAAGIYLVRLRAGANTTQARIAVLR